MRRRCNRLLWLLKPLSLIVAVLLVFGLVWLRSSVVTMEYSLSKLEKKKCDIARENKNLAAERARLLHVGRFEQASTSGFAFPDRVKVVSVQRTRAGEARQVSLLIAKQTAPRVGQEH